MKRQIVFTVALCTFGAILSGAPLQTKVVADDALIGNWELVTLMQSGEEDEGAAGMRVIITANTMRPAQAPAEMAFAYDVDVEAMLHTIDVMAPFLPGEMKNLGIYEIDGDTLTICMNVAPEHPRPTEFTSTAENERSLQTLTRVKE